MKQFTKAMYFENSDVFQHMRFMFPKRSEAKLKCGIFIGPYIRKMLELENYRKLINDFITQYHILRCRMSIKMHYLHSHLDFFRPNMGDVSEEHGERFHQDILTMANRYTGK